MGKVIMSGVSKGMTVPSEFFASFSDNTWAQIIKACENKAVPDTWEVGDQKAMTINGVDYMIDIIGKNHDAYSTGSFGEIGDTAPLTFQMHDCYNTKYQMNDSGSTTTSWYASAMALTHLPAILELMPSEVQAGIKEVSKKSSFGGENSGNIFWGNEKLFLLSEVEVFGANTNSASGEGDQYSYYASGNTKVKNHSGGSTIWWLRSPSVGNSSWYCAVNTIGSATDYNGTNALGVSFAFCF